MVLNSISFGGQNQGSGAWSGTFETQNALFLKVFGGEVMAAFEKYTVTSDKHRIRSISSGKSAQFPFTGRTTARRFKPGSDILVDDAQSIGAGAGQALVTPKLLGQIKASEKVINIDDLLIATCFIDELDQAKSHYDYRGPFSRELGRALAFEFDTNVLKTALKSAADSTALTDPFATSQHLTDAAEAGTITSAELLDAIYTAAKGFDERYVPEDGRFVFVRPQEYYALVKDTASGNGTALLHRDYAGGESNGSFTEGFVLKAAGMTVVKTPHLPNGDTRYDTDGAGGGTTYLDANPGENNDYQDNYANVVALCMHPEAVGTVKLKDLTMESEYQIRHQGDLMVAKMACGTGALRPECVARIDL